MFRVAPLLLLIGCTASQPPTKPAATARRILHFQPGEIVEPAANATASALALVDRIAPRWGFAIVPELSPRGEIAVGGGTLVRLQQIVDGIPVEAGELHVLVAPGGELVAASGVPASADLPREGAFSGTETEAIARAVAPRTPGNSRARRVWHRDGDRLIAAWLVEAYLDDGDAVRTVIAASDGRVLAHRSLVESDVPFQYRVWADTTPELHPHDSPNADFCPYPHPTIESDYPSRVASSLVSYAGVDPWLPPGATETNGNNIDAYTDANAPDGLTAGDFRASVTAPNTFDRSYDFSMGPLATHDQQMASITALFFTLNYMHDFWYGMGLTEAAGNAQASNYGRGGVEGDPIHAEAEDSALMGQRNNANMTTPDDGMSPRMQVYVWTGADHHQLTIAGADHATVSAAFGPTMYATTGIVVAANDSGAVITDGCTAFSNDVTGKIALVDRGTCSFKTKALNAQTAGAVGILIADNVAATVPPTLGDDSTVTTTITIAAMSLTQADGAAVRATLGTSPSATLVRNLDPDLDGSLDATVIAHEHGHYLHHRLSQCNTTMCGAMSEGWADFSALMMTSRAGDDFAHGAFPLAQYATVSFGNPAYFGIRRVPYSADRAFDPLTFIDMADGTVLPTTAPIALSGASNSEVHNAGEIWATMLWDVYAQIQAEVGDFDTARTRMAKDIVAGLMLAPPDATPTEMRDALITAAGAAVPGDDLVFATAFANRGLGSCAVSPPRESQDFTGIVESAVLLGNAVTDPAAITDGSCIADETLDSGQTLTVTVPLTNVGFFAVDGVSLAVTTPTPGLTIDNPTVAIGSLAPHAHHDLALTVHYDAGAMKGTPVAGELDIAVTATNGCTTSTVQKLPLRLDVDDTISGEHDDHFDTEKTTWTASSDVSWQHVYPTALNGAWHGADIGAAGSGTLTSPQLGVQQDQDFTIQFTHRYQFEFSDSTAWDAGVIEISSDGGKTWVDVSMFADPGYGTTVVTSASGNPLAGRVGYTNQNASYPNTDQVTLSFGRAFAGQTVQLRFNLGTDAAQGAGGWDIDDFLVTGATNAPFGAALPTTGTCGAAGDPGGDGGGCCNTTQPLRGATLLLVGVVGLMLRRKNQRAS